MPYTQRMNFLIHTFRKFLKLSRNPKKLCTTQLNTKQFAVLVKLIKGTLSKHEKQT